MRISLYLLTQWSRRYFVSTYFKPLYLQVIAIVGEESKPRSIISDADLFRLDSPDIYTLEGPNQVGKTSLIKAIMGVLPPNLTHQSIANYITKNNKSVSIVLDGSQIDIDSVSTAQKNGLVAVFQDDQLIPTMTLLEQLIMRHSKSNLGGLFEVFSRLSKLAFNNIYSLLFDIFKHSVPVPPKINKILADKFLPTPEEIRNSADEILKYYIEINEGEYKDLLNKYPHEMSNGAKAVARLINAQLSRNIRILFLDEAFNGVQSDIWPRIIDKLKSWARKTGTAIVAVSHNTEEIIRWQPNKMFIIKKIYVKVTEKGIEKEIETGVVEVKPPTGYDSLEAGLPLRVDKFPLFIIDRNDKYPKILASFKEPFVIIYDEALQNNALTKRIINSCIGEKKEIPITITETAKDWGTYTKLISFFAEILPRPTGTIIIIGGGVVLNSVGFIAATLHRGLTNFILVPTTVMAMADVAVGSKTSLNFIAEGHNIFFKHLLGVYANPSAIILDPKYLDSLSIEQKKYGLSECLKHGLLQNPELYKKTLALMKSITPNNQELFQAALYAMELKSQVLSVDPWEQKFGGILLYGHLHAHSLERATRFKLPHGLCVYWGILIDLKIAGFLEYEIIIEALDKKILIEPLYNELKSINHEILRKAYEYDTKPIHFDNNSNFMILHVSSIGEFSVEHKSLPWIKVNWDKVLDAITSIQRDFEKKLLS